MWMALLVLLLTRVALPSVSLSQQAADQASELAGTAWQLVHFQGGDDTLLKPDDPSRYTIAFNADGTLSARVDCNHGRGTWTSERSGHLEFGPLALTLAMCPPGSMHDQIAKQWGYVRSYVLRDGHLHLSLLADGGIYKFRPEKGNPEAAADSPGPSHAGGAAGASTPPFEKTRWAATHLGHVIVSAVGPRAPHLVFDGERVAGSDGCNRVTGSYTRTGDRVTLGPLASTRMACPGTATVEKAFGEAVAQARRWHVADGALELLDADGTRVARFEPQGEP